LSVIGLKLSAIAIIPVIHNGPANQRLYRLVAHRVILLPRGNAVAFKKAMATKLVPM
jgi:hypothetical protein